MNYSVIIPNFNSGDKLVRLVKSIPDRHDIEVIVVDDVSTDNSLIDLSKLNREHPVTIEILEHKKYAGGARNKGIELSCGKYLIFADSDDWFIESAFKIFDRESCEDIDLILFESAAYKDSGINKSDRDNYRNARILFSPRKAALGAVSPWGKLIKRDFVLSESLYFSEVVAANDVVFSVKAACLARSIKISRNIVYIVDDNPYSITASINFEKIMARLGEQKKRISLIKKYKPVSPFFYTLFHSRLLYFEKIKSSISDVKCVKKFNIDLKEYKRQLGVAGFIVMCVGVVPFAQKIGSYVQIEAVIFFKRMIYGRRK